MRSAVNKEMENAMDDFESTLPDAPESIEAEHFMEEFKPAQVTAAKLAELKAKYSGLVIAGVEDKKGYELVHAARMEVRAYRTAVEKVRKALKEESLAYGRKVDAEAKRLTASLQEIEGPLGEQEDRYDAEVERLKAERQREKEAKLQSRVDALAAVGASLNIGELATMPDTAFAFLLATSTEAWEAKEKIRKDAEAALAEKLEAERLAAEAKAKEEEEAKAKREAELKAEAERQAAERAELDKARAALEAEKRAIDQAAREEQIRKDAEARAKADAERRAQEEKERQERAATEAEARKAARPDAEKLLALAKVLQETAWPKMATPAGERIVLEVQESMGKFVKFIEKKAADLAGPQVAG